MKYKNAWILILVALCSQFNIGIGGEGYCLSFLGALIGIGASLLGSSGSSSGGDATVANAEANREAALQIEEATNTYRKRIRKKTKKTRKQIRRAIDSVQEVQGFPNLQFDRSKSPLEFIQDGIDLSRVSFDTRTEQKRENLDFALGESGDNLRQAQLDFSALASGDTTAFQKEVRASAFGELAKSAGFPVGAFENASARNLLNFRQVGLQNTLGISDFFARQGTVDPVDPIDNIFRLAAFEQVEDSEKQQLDVFNRDLEFNRRKTNAQIQLDLAGFKIGSEQNLLQLLADTEGKALDSYTEAYKLYASQGGAEEAAAAQSAAGSGEALSQIAGQFGEGGGLSGILGSGGGGGGGFLGGLFG